MENKVSLPKDVSGLHIHFVGIKGTGMAALVEILHARGAYITGSDVSERFYTDEILEKLNLKALPFSEENITENIDYVIHSSAYKADTNPDLIAAKKKNIPTLLYTEALGDLSRMAYSCAVCGVHGKTTTTGLVGTLLKKLPLNAQVLAGSVISSFNSSCTMTSKDFDKSEKHYFVAETCEYQRHFMSFSPEKIILTSVESDHQDYYPTYEDIRDAFVDFICKLPENGTLIYCADDKGAVETAFIAKKKRPDIKLIPYGSLADNGITLSFGRIEKGKQYFSTSILGECALSVPGEHLVRNATAAIALVNELLREDGKDISEYAKEIKTALLDFAGGKRRSEIVGKTKTPSGEELIVIDDYGHHPTAIKTTLAGYRAFYRKHKMIVDFMSHTYTRTAALLEDFAQAFPDADLVIINKIYGSARENKENAPVTGEILYEHTKKYNPNSFYADDFDSAAKLILSELNKPSGTKDGYLLVTMGAGDNWKVGKKVLEELAK